MLQISGMLHEICHAGIIGGTIFGGHEVWHLIHDPAILRPRDDMLGPRQVVVEKTAIRERAANRLKKK